MNGVRQGGAWKRTIWARVVALTAVALPLRAAVVNVDLNVEAADPVYSGANGILSAGGAYWNGLHALQAFPATNLLTETSQATPLSIAVPNGMYGDYFPAVANTLQDSGWLPDWPSLIIRIENLISAEPYDVSVYSTFLPAWMEGATTVAVQHASGEAGGRFVSTPSGIMPGQPNVDYILFTNLYPIESSPGAGSLRIVTPLNAFTYYDNPVVGFQIRGNFSLAGVSNGPSGVTNFVSPQGLHVYPFTSWSNAATNVQAAVDAAGTNNLVLVADGVYGAPSTGAANAVWVNKPVRLQSANGPAFAVIDGGSLRRCLRVTHSNAVVRGFTFRNGYVSSASSAQGGGALLEQGLMAQCVVQSNRAAVSANASGAITASGGGIHAGSAARIRSCLVQGNWASAVAVPAYTNDPFYPSCPGSYSLSGSGLYYAYGGGIRGGVVEGCTVVGNTAAASSAGYTSVLAVALGGGVYASTLENCIVAVNSTDNVSGVTASYTFALPLQAGTGNTTNGPAFASGSDLHLAATSPCAGAGVVRSWMTNDTGLDGLPRTSGGLASLGAYEQARLGAGPAAPSIAAPVPVPAGGTNTEWTAASALSVSGTKDPGGWLAVSLPGGGFTTGGVAQTFAGTTWTAQVSTAYIATNQARLIEFRCATAGTATAVSSAATWLRVARGGNGPANVWISSVVSGVIYTADTLALAGSNGVDVAGSLQVSNEANGSVVFADAPVQSPRVWVAPPIPLALGSNRVSVCGTNLFGASACDTRVLFRGGAGAPQVDVTNADQFVSYGVTNIALGGSNNVHVTGDLLAYNAGTGLTTNFPAPGASPHRWNAPALPLAVGANAVLVSGTNAVGGQASDLVTITRAGAGTPSIAVLSPSRAYAFGVTSVVLSCSNNPHVVGTMTVSNSGDGRVYLAAAPAFATTTWSLSPLSLAPGTNRFRVAGTNALGGQASAELLLVRLTNAVLYVWASNATPAAPFVTPATAATNLQQAIDEAGSMGTVLVDRGAYGGVVITNALLVRSLFGPTSAVIKTTGGRCAYISATNAVLEGFTLKGAYFQYGGQGAGAYVARGAVLANCLIVSNSTQSGSVLPACPQYPSAPYYGYGGGVYCDAGGAVRSCLVAQNYAGTGGGGIYCCTNGVVQNCTIVSNMAAAGGGIYFAQGGLAENCIVYFNGGGNIQSAGATNNVQYCDTSPLYPGPGNTSLDPAFINRALSNYRLQSASPCIDRGTNASWMADALEFDGKPRILSGRVDMGCYELPIVVAVRAFLQGAYDPALHRMSQALALSGSLPERAPYAADARLAAPLPSNAVDWVLIQARDATNGALLASRSGLLDPYGYVMDTDGSTGVVLNVVFGNQVNVVVSHRNHLAAQSVQPQAVAGWLLSLDLTASVAAYLGGSNAAVQVEPGVWALPAGDADGDGALQPADHAIWRTQEGR